LVGCGSGGTAIEGTAKFADGTPLTRGTVVLTNDANSYRGAVSREGKFTIEAVASGDYNVAVTGTTVSDGGGDVDVMEYNDETGEYVHKQDETPEEVNMLADRFSDPVASGLTLKVPDSSYDLEVAAP